MHKGGETKTSVRKVSAAERQRQAMELRLTGASYHAIAEQLGYASPSGASKAIQTAMLKTIQEPAPAVRQMELDRLDKLMVSAWPLAIQGDHKAFDRVMRCLERRAALLGLDAPKRAQVLTAGVELTEEERQRIWQMLGLGGTPEPKQVPSLPCGLKELPGQREQEDSVVDDECRPVTVVDSVASTTNPLPITSLADLERGLDEIAATLPK